LDVAALSRNSKHQPSRVSVISEAHIRIHLPRAGRRSALCAYLILHPYGAACRDHWLNAGDSPVQSARMARRTRLKAKQSSLAREDLKVDLHFVLDLNHSATDAEGRDSKISLFENSVCCVRLAGLSHRQADRFGETV
jgi:hypothetical protein